MRASKIPNAAEIDERLKNLGDVIIDAILDDDPKSKFIEYIDNPNQIFKSNYKLPDILLHSPPIISVCCFFGSVNCYRALIDLGADPLINDELNYSTAHFVSFSGNLEIARDLFKHGVDFNQPAFQLFQYMPFLQSIHEFYPQDIAAINWKQDFINWLWLHGCQIEKTLLIYSSAYGNMATVKFLFDILHFFNKDDIDEETKDIINISVNSAAVNGQDEVMSYLINVFPQIDLVDALVYATRNGSISCVKVCYEHQRSIGDVDAWVAFLNACAFGHLDIVLYFMKAGVEPDMRAAISRRMMTPLGCAVNNDHLQVAEILIKNGYARVSSAFRSRMRKSSETKLSSSLNSNSNETKLNSNETKLNSSLNEINSNSNSFLNSNEINSNNSSLILNSNEKNSKPSYSNDDDNGDCEKGLVLTSSSVSHAFFDEDPKLLLENATRNGNLEMVKLVKDAFNIDVSCLSNVANISLRAKNLPITDYFVSNGVPVKDLAYSNFFLRNKKSKQTIKDDQPFVDYFISKGLLDYEEVPFYLILSGDLQGLIYVLNQGCTISETYLNRNINQIIKENLNGRKYDMIDYLLDNYNLKVNDKILFGLEINDQKTYFNLVKKFIDKGISLSTPKNGHSLLYYAFINNNLNVINLLKENGADFTHVAIPINSFQNSKFFPVIKDLFDNDNDFSKCEPKGSGKSFFITHIYYHCQNKDLLNYLFQIGFINDTNKKLDDDKDTLLDFALYNEDVETMIFLLSNNALIEDARNPQDAFVDFAKSANNNILSDLIYKQIESYYSLELD